MSGLGRRRLLTNSASGLILMGISMVITFVLSPILVRELGKANYGVWEILLAFTSYLGILEIGLGPAVVRYAAVATRTGDREELSRLASSSLAVFSLIGMVAMIVMAVLSIRPEIILNHETDDRYQYTMAFLLVGASLCVQFGGTALSGILLGQQEHFKVNLARGVTGVASGVAVGLLLTRSEFPPILVVSGMHFAGTAAMYSAIAGFAFAGELKPEIRLASISREHIRKLYVFGFKSFLLSVSDRLRKASMPFVITHVMGIQYVVYFALAGRLVEYAERIGSALGFPLTSYFSALSEEEDRTQLVREWLFFSRFVGSLHLLLGGLVLCLGADFLARWMGAEYAQEARLAIMWLALGSLVRGTAPNSARLLISMARHEKAVKITLPASIMCVVVAIPSTYLWGVAGAGFSLFIASDLAVILVLRESCRIASVPLRRYFSSTVAKSVIPLAGMVVSIATIRSMLSPESYLAIASLVGAGSIIYVGLAWFTVVSATERRFLIHRIRDTQNHCE